MAKTKQNSNTQITARLPAMLVDQLDRYVDGQTFRNRSHAVQVIVSLWIESKAREGKGKQETIFPLVRGKKQ